MFVSAIASFLASLRCFMASHLHVQRCLVMTAWLVDTASPQPSHIITSGRVFLAHKKWMIPLEFHVAVTVFAPFLVMKTPMLSLGYKTYRTRDIQVNKIRSFGRSSIPLHLVTGRVDSLRDTSPLGKLWKGKIVSMHPT